MGEIFWKAAAFNQDLCHFGANFNLLKNRSAKMFMAMFEDTACAAGDGDPSVQPSWTVVCGCRLYGVVP